MNKIKLLTQLESIKGPTRAKTRKNRGGSSK
jgi:hypothetical protein